MFRWHRKRSSKVGTTPCGPPWFKLQMTKEQSTVLGNVTQRSINWFGGLRNYFSKYFISYLRGFEDKTNAKNTFFSIPGH